MNRRNFLQSFILTLLTLLFGPKVVAVLTSEQLEPMFQWAGKRLPIEDIVAEAAEMLRNNRGRPDTLWVSEETYKELSEALRS